MTTGSSGGNGKRHRITGTLNHGPRGYTLATQTGEIWVLAQEEPHPDFIGKIVTVEGVSIGLDRLKVDWIGHAHD